MSEMPEKKVLKSILLELKSRSLASSDEMNKQQDAFYAMFETINSKMKSFNTKDMAPQSKELVNTLGELFYVVTVGVSNLTKTLHRSQEDMRLYVKTLEEYATELDNTLTQIFAQAKQQAEEEIKHMQELAERTPTKPYSV
jgi:hypothetical protein